MLKKAPKRLSSVKKQAVHPLPNLVEVQINSYRKFLQEDTPPHERVAEGLQAVFKEHFPVKSYDGTIELDFISYELTPPKYSPEECIHRGISYSMILKATFSLEQDYRGRTEEEVFLGSIPKMTDNGTFIINGAERVIVSQLHRSPGLCYETAVGPKGQTIYGFRLIPYRGSWLEASFDQNDMIQVYVDRTKRRKKILATSFLRTLNLSTDAEIIEAFMDTQLMKIRGEADFDKLVGKVLAEDVVHKETGVSYGLAGEKLSTAMLKRMLDDKIDRVRVINGADSNHPILKMLAKDQTDSYESALKKFYSVIRPNEPATVASARAQMLRLFFDSKRFSLNRVGRYKINTKLGFPINDDSDLDRVTLRPDDIIESIRYLIKLRQGDPDCHVDDIDHLGNRRVRTVGELIQNQCRIGLARMESVMKEKMALIDSATDDHRPGKVISSKGLGSVLLDFFGRSQLSQFMDQTNPLAELTHKRRLSSLGPGGLNRDRAGFEVRDVHPSHYGRICPIETPEGPNIGLISSLATYAKINEFGFIETPYQEVKDGQVTETIVYLTADQEAKAVIAQASAPVDEAGMLEGDQCWVRINGESFMKDTKDVTHMDVSSKQLVSVATSLIPFLEHDDANRALMGSNMQRQAVPLLRTDAPLVGTGLEERTARDSGAVVISKESGTVVYVDGKEIHVQSNLDKDKVEIYKLKKFQRSNSGTCINQKPLCEMGDKVKAGTILADGPATDKGELALGRNVLVAFMPWCGYNYEDAIIISEKLVADDIYTSIHIEDFEVTARDTKLGAEKITRDLPNVSEEMKAQLLSDGIIRVGAPVKPGDILAGKVVPKDVTDRSAEVKLIQTIFSQASFDIKEASLRAPTGTSGFVIATNFFRRTDRLSKTEDAIVYEQSRSQDLLKEYKEKIELWELDLKTNLAALFTKSDGTPEMCTTTISNRRTGEVIIEENTPFDIDEHIAHLQETDPKDLIFEKGHKLLDKMGEVLRAAKKSKEELHIKYKAERDLIKKGCTDLDVGVLHQVKVRVATKRKLQVGDKMAGRHGNKGVVSNIVPVQDLPYLSDGTPVDIILNPLGVPSRMNMGQLLETSLGYAAKKMGIYVKSPVFEGFPESKISEMMSEAGLNPSGKSVLYDGRTGERFTYPVVVGMIYMLKLGHLVADKIHARSIGPYSLVTQQPLGGKAQKGGQRFGEMEVWALEAYGAAHTLQEMLTVKSDDVDGRTRTYQSIVKGENVLQAGVPASFDVLVSELKGLGLKLDRIRKEEEPVVTATST